MEVTDQVKQEIRELALLYEECLNAAKEIDQDILGKIPASSYSLSTEDYRGIASSIFIEHCKQQGRKRNKAKADGEPSTDKQQAFIAGLATKGGKKAGNIIDQFLENNEVKLVDRLTKSQATSLIDLLQEAQR